ncbi:unnamed protein product [Arctogadus glacialis]
MNGEVMRGEERRGEEKALPWTFQQRSLRPTKDQSEGKGLLLCFEEQADGPPESYLIQVPRIETCLGSPACAL